MATKICSGCGTEVEAGTVYCPKCGGRVDRAAASGELQPAPPAANEQTPAKKFRERASGGGAPGGGPAEGS